MVREQKEVRWGLWFSRRNDVWSLQTRSLARCLARVLDWMVCKQQWWWWWWWLRSQVLRGSPEKLINLASENPETYRSKATSLRLTCGGHSATQERPRDSHCVYRWSGEASWRRWTQICTDEIWTLSYTIERWIFPSEVTAFQSKKKKKGPRVESELKNWELDRCQVMKNLG